MKIKSETLVRQKSMVNWKTNAGPLPKGILIDSNVISGFLSQWCGPTSFPYEILSIYCNSIASPIKSGVPVRSSLSGAGNRCQEIEILTRHRDDGGKPGMSLLFIGGKSLFLHFCLTYVLNYLALLSFDYLGIFFAFFRYSSMQKHG